MFGNNPYNSALFKNYDEEFPPLNQTLIQRIIPTAKSKARRANINHCHAILLRGDLNEEQKISLLQKEFNLGIKNIDTPIIQGDTLLHYAAKLGLTKVAKFLLEKGAKANVFNKICYWPLHTAIAFGQLDTFKLLFCYGGDFVTPQKLQSYGLNPLTTLLHIAVHHHQEEMADFFLSNFDCKDALRETQYSLLISYCDAPKITNTNILQRLLSTIVTVNIIQYDHTLLTYLLNRSWNPTSRYRVSRGYTGSDLRNMFLYPSNMDKPKIFAAAKLLFAAGVNPYYYERDPVRRMVHPFVLRNHDYLMKKIPLGIKDYCAEPAFLRLRNNMDNQLRILQGKCFFNDLSVQEAYQKYIPAHETNYALLNFFHEYLGRIFHFSMGWNKEEYYNTFITWLNKKRLTAPEEGSFKETGIATKQELDTLKQIVEKMHGGEIKPYYFMQCICETLGIVQSCEKSLTMESIDTLEQTNMPLIECVAPTMRR